MDLYSLRTGQQRERARLSGLCMLLISLLGCTPSVSHNQPPRSITVPQEQPERGLRPPAPTPSAPTASSAYKDPVSGSTDEQRAQAVLQKRQALQETARQSLALLDTFLALEKVA